MSAALLPLLLAIVAGWLIATVTFTRTLEQRVAEQLGNTADVLTGSGLPFTPELLQRIAELQRTSITLLDSSGAILLSTEGELADALRESIDKGAVAGLASSSLSAVEFNGRPAMVATRVLPAGIDPRASTLIVAASLEDARDAASRAAWGMGLAALAAALLLVVIQYFLVRGITRPIDELVEMANGIAAGRRDVQASTSRQDEIAALGQALNAMTGKLQAYESELAERSRFAALGELSARIAHEIRNPLTGLKLNLQLLAERTGSTDQARLQKLLEEVARLELIVTSSLSLARSRPAEKRPEDLNGVVSEVLQLMEPSLRHRHIVLETRIASIPAFPIDRDRIKQALLNLLVNASDALVDGGRVVVSTGSTADVASITIEDSGPGIAPELREKLHTISTSTKPFGLGLGLRICREVAEEHQGRLLVDTSEELRGARLTLELPLQAQA
jgi:signal transduction histidine kinase